MKRSHATTLLLALGAALVFWSTCASGWYYVPDQEVDLETTRTVETIRGLGPSTVTTSFDDDTPSYSTVKHLGDTVFFSALAVVVVAVIGLVLALAKRGFRGGPRKSLTVLVVMVPIHVVAGAYLASRLPGFAPLRQGTLGWGVPVWLFGCACLLGAAIAMLPPTADSASPVEPSPPSPER